MIYAGKRKANDAYLGTTRVKRMYLGGALVYGLQCDVTLTLTGATCDAPGKILWGEPMTATLAGETGKQVLPSTVKVTMGGTNITSTAFDYETNTITIASVTGAVTIEAEAVTMDSAYKPLMWIESTSYSNGSGPIVTPYYPCSSTKIEMECASSYGSGTYCYMFGTDGYATNPRYGFHPKYANTTSTAFAFGNNIAQNTNMIKFSYDKQLVVADGNKCTYTDSNGTRRTITVNSSQSTPWRSTRALQLGCVKVGSSTWWSKTRLWSVKISESGTVLYRYYPARKVSESKIGILDVLTGNFIAADSTWTASDAT